MRWTPSHNAFPWWMLAISLCFNIGFVATYSVKTYAPEHAATPPTEQTATAPRPDKERDDWRKRWEEQQHDAPFPREYELLNLTEAQREAFRNSRDELFREGARLRLQMRSEHRTLGGLLLDDQADDAAIDAQLDVIADLQKQMQRLMVTHLRQQRDLLTDEQLDAFRDIIRRKIIPMEFDRGGRRGGGRGMMGDGHRGDGPRGERPGREFERGGFGDPDRPRDDGPPPHSPMDEGGLLF
jgi:Spy/CpxP family protein refolding chaperone